MSVDCSALSEDLGEALAGTAPSEAGFLILEEPGPWGRDALRDCGLDADLADAIDAHATEAGLRLQVVRRSQARYTPAPRHVWLTCVTPGRRFLEAITVFEASEILDLDLTGVCEGRPSGAGTLEDEPLHLVCTHGRRDACCARRGRPLWKALAAAAPGRVWQSSHLGGHRFAATMAVLPLGLWLGRVPAARADDIARAAERGETDPTLLRGRAGLPPAAQAADAHLRAEREITEVDAIEILSTDGDRISARTPSGTVELIVRREPTGTDRPVSCGIAAKVEDPGRWVVESQPSLSGPATSTRA